MALAKSSFRLATNLFPVCVALATADSTVTQVGTFSFSSDRNPKTTNIFSFCTDWHWSNPAMKSHPSSLIICNMNQRKSEFMKNHLYQLDLASFIFLAFSLNTTSLSFLQIDPIKCVDHHTMCVDGICLVLDVMLKWTAALFELKRAIFQFCLEVFYTCIKWGKSSS